MRSAFAITWMFVAAGCAAPPRPDVQTPQNDPLSAQTQLEFLRSLEGDWWGRGGQGTDRNVVEFQYRVKSGGAVIAETCFSGTPEETLTLYAVENGRLIGTRYTVSKVDKLVGSEPRPFWRGKFKTSGPITTTASGNFDMEMDVPLRMPPVDPNVEWTQDTNRRALAFSIVDPTNEAMADPSMVPEIELWLIEAGTLHITCWQDSSSADLHDMKAYQLTRKLPGSVEKKASREGSEYPSASAGKSSGSVRAYGDLRSDR